MAQIQPGVVLDQAAIELQHVAGAGHDRQAAHPVARHAVTQHPNAAGIGGHRAAGLRGFGGRPVDRVIQRILRGVALHFADGGAGRYRDRGFSYIQVLD